MHEHPRASRPAPLGPLRRRGCLALLAAALLALSLALALALAEPLDPYNRTVGPAKILDSVYRQSGPADLAICRCRSSAELSLEGSHGFVTRASLFLPARSSPRAGVVILHGNTALGRQLALYPVLATRLARRGYAVITYDRLGFGESDDPFARGPEAARAALERSSLLRAAIAALSSRFETPLPGIAVIGHSAGAVTALDSGLTLNEVDRIVLIGPPRRVLERSQDPRDLDYFVRRFDETHRFVYRRPPPDWVSRELRAHEGREPLERYLGPLLDPEPKPLLLVDGEREDSADLRYLDELAARLPGRVRLLRLRRSDHYGNTAQSLGFSFYDRAVMAELVDALEAFLDG